MTRMAQTQALPDVEHDDVLIGEAVHAAMWRARVTQTQLASVLGLDQAAVSRRLRGRTSWKVSEIRLAAALLSVRVADLLPPDELGLNPAVTREDVAAEIRCTQPPVEATAFALPQRREAFPDAA